MIDCYKVLAAADKLKASQELHEEDVEINKLLGETETIERGEVPLVRLGAFLLFLNRSFRSARSLERTFVPQ